MSRRRWLLRNAVRAVPLASLAGALLACGQDAPPPELPPRAIRWMSVSESVVDEQRVISGILVARDDSQLGFEVGGTVQSVEVEMGSAVQRDQVLASLDPEPFELAVRNAEALHAAQKAFLADARADNVRAMALFKEDVISVAERDRARARFESTESRVEAAAAQLELSNDSGWKAKAFHLCASAGSFDTGSLTYINISNVNAEPLLATPVRRNRDCDRARQ